MLHHLTGGSWGLVIRRPLKSGAMNVLPLAFLFLPIALGVHSLYPWAHGDSAGHAEVGEHSLYLTEPFFLIRAGVYFVIWIAMALVINGLSNRQDAKSDPAPSRWLQGISGPGIALLFLAATFSAIDWGMSLDPKWTSTIYGVMLIIGDALTTLAMMIVVASFLAADKPMSEIATPGRLNDLGNLMLAFVMLWAYMSFCQFLIIWSGNLTEEIPWYLRRTRGGWQWVALSLIVFNFFLPFLVLLFRSNKRETKKVSRVALWILFMHWVNLVWLVIPASSDPASPQILWVEVFLSRDRDRRDRRDLGCVHDLLAQRPASSCRYMIPTWSRPLSTLEDTENGGLSSPGTNRPGRPWPRSQHPGASRASSCSPWCSSAWGCG